MWGCVAGEKWAAWAGESATEHLMHVLSFRREVRGAEGLRAPDVGETLENYGVQIGKAGGPAARLGAAAPPRGPAAGGAGLSRDRRVRGRRCWAGPGAGLGSEGLLAGVPDAMWGFLLPLESGPGGEGGGGWTLAEGGASSRGWELVVPTGTQQWLVCQEF